MTTKFLKSVSLEPLECSTRRLLPFLGGAAVLTELSGRLETDGDLLADLVTGPVQKRFCTPVVMTEVLLDIGEPIKVWSLTPSWFSVSLSSTKI